MPDRGSTRIAITDNTKSNYARVHLDWESSDPKGYSEWFKAQMEVRFNAIRSQMALNASANVEEIPEYRVKTPLQRVIQILKRHRDVIFQDDSSNKPVSIIITTLAALAYNNESDLYEALKTIINGMGRFVTQKNGEFFVVNPVNPEENFAEKWTGNSILRENFYSWLEAAQSTFIKMEQSRNAEEMITTMGATFGKITASKVACFVPQSNAVKSVPLMIEPMTASKPKPWRK